MTNKFSFRVQQVMTFCREEAVRLGHDAIGTEHILLGILRLPESTAVRILNNLGGETEELRDALIEVSSQEATTLKVDANISFTKKADLVLRHSYMEAKNYSSDIIGTEHLLLALAKIHDGLAAQVLNGFNITYESIRVELDHLQREGELVAARPLSPLIKEKTRTPALDQFSRDLTQAARENKLDPIIGRDKEIERVAQILSRRKKNNPVLIGDPGVGKTAIVEGMALRIVQQRVSPILFNKRVVMLDLGGVVAGTKYRGQFEERIKALISELEKDRDIIIFIDELHTLVGAGAASGSLDASNMFKPSLARGELQCIGATTLDEYRQHIEKDGALERRFQKIIVEAPTITETVDILTGLKERYETHHNVAYSEAAVEAAVKLAARYITDRFLPDKALDVIDEAGARARLNSVSVPKAILDLERESDRLRKLKEELVKVQEYEKAAQVRDLKRKLDDALLIERDAWEKSTRSKPVQITEDHIAEVVAQMTGIPITRVMVTESHRLLNIEKQLSKRIIGQNDALSAIARAIKRNRTGLNQRNRPIGSFIFLGPSGVGKTETARALAEFLFEDANALIRVDMSEYMEKHNVSRLIGAPPGYVGYDEGGQLSEKVRRKPYSIVLFDEIEKAHPDVFNMLLQALDYGHLTDGSGRNVDFRNTILIMTSNAGTREGAKAKGFGFSDDVQYSEGDYRQMAEKMKGIMRELFRPEFLNRVDDVVVFHQLSRDNIYEILDIHLTDLAERLAEQQVTLHLSQDVKDFIVSEGYSLETGARLLQRMAERYIEDPLAEQMLRGNLENRSIIDARMEGGRIMFDQRPLAKAEERVKSR